MARNKKEILTYHAPWTVYSMSWCRGKEKYCANRFRMAISSFKEEYSNQVQIIQLFEDEQPVAGADGGLGPISTDTKETAPSFSFQPVCQFDHPYPATKVSHAINE
jgi:hypothetical protein